MAKSSRVLNQAILKVVDNQIRDLTPPATRETFDRLVREGVTEDEARRLIARVVASEIFDVLKHERPYDEERYLKALKKLPELPE
ncbi:MAG: hypothetical protein M3Q91_01370 [Acidobacteriota bacterium]|nr:hypothetical protein [Acidobacteriota bacterium]